MTVPFDSALSNYVPAIGAWASSQVPIRVQSFADVSAADDDAFKTSFASTIAAQTFATTALNGVVGAGLLNPARNVVVTTGGTTPADAPATATIAGLSPDGSAQTETIAIAQTATTAAGSKCFSRVTSIVLAVGQGTGATLKFGTGNLLGLDAKLRDVGGVAGAAVLREVEGTAAVTTGTFKSAAESAPNGAYAPATAPNGTRDYALVYLVGV